MQRILVESEAAYRYAAARADREREWLTTSPWLLDLLPREGEAVVSLEKGVESGDEVRISRAAMAFAEVVATRLDGLDLGGLRLGKAMFAALRMCCNPFFYKAWLLGRALAGGDLVVVGNPGLTLPGFLGCGAGRFDTLYAAMAYRMTDGPQVLRFEDQGGEEQIRRMRHVGTSLFERLISLLNANAGSLWLRFMRKVLRGNWPGLPGARLFLVGRQCELVEDAAFGLAVRGARLRLAAMPSGGERGEIPAGFDVPSLAPWLWECLGRISREYGLPCDEAQRAALAAILELSSEGLRYAVSTSRVVEASAADIKATGCSALLTNGLSSVVERLLFQALDRIGVPVIGFEHGLHEGLGSSSLYSVGTCSTLQSHAAICLTPVAAEHFVRHGADHPLAVAGEFEAIKRVRMPWLQRFVVSRKIGVRSGERICMYVMTSNRNNILQGPHGQIDKEFVAITGSVSEIIHQSPYTALLKPYPSNRYLDPEPLERRYAGAGKTKVLQYLEYRYLRSCADVIVLDSAQSVLAWAWGTRRPMIFLQLSSDPLLPEARLALEESVFFVDLAGNGWERQLQELLRMPFGELQSRWRAKAKPRARVSERFIMGPPGNSGARAARSVLDWVGQGQLVGHYPTNG